MTDDTARSVAFRHYNNVDGVGFALDRGHAFRAGFDAALKFAREGKVGKHVSPSVAEALVIVEDAQCNGDAPLREAYAALRVLKSALQEANSVEEDMLQDVRTALHGDLPLCEPGAWLDAMMALRTLRKAYEIGERDALRASGKWCANSASPFHHDGGGERRAAPCYCRSGSERLAAGEAHEKHCPQYAKVGAGTCICGPGLGHEMGCPKLVSP